MLLSFASVAALFQLITASEVDGGTLSQKHIRLWNAQTKVGLHLKEKMFNNSKNPMLPVGWRTHHLTLCRNSRFIHQICLSWPMNRSESLCKSLKDGMTTMMTTSLHCIPQPSFLVKELSPLFFKYLESCIDRRWGEVKEMTIVGTILCRWQDERVFEHFESKSKANLWKNFEKLLQSELRSTAVPFAVAVPKKHRFSVKRASVKRWSFAEAEAEVPFKNGVMLHMFQDV